MSPVLFLLSSVSFASEGAVAAVSRLATWDNGATVACAPAAEVVEFAKAAALDSLLGAARGPGGQLLTATLAGLSADSGLDLEGPLALSLLDTGADSFLFEIPFRGDEEAAEALFGVLSPESRLGEAGAWAMDPFKGEPGVARLADARVTVTYGARPEGQAGSAAALLEGLPTSPGCAFHLGLDGKDGKLKTPLELVGFLPLRGGTDAIFRLNAVGHPAPAQLGAGSAGPSWGSSTEAPVGVITLGLPGDDLLAVLQQGAPVDVVGKVGELRDAVLIGSGISVAFFGDPRQLNFALAVPVATRDGKPISAKRLQKGLLKVLEAEDLAAQKTGKNSLVFQMKDRAMTAVTSKGLVALGSNPTAVEDAALGRGQPWVGPALAQATTAWPIALQFSKAGDPTEVVMGLRTRDGVWEAMAAVHTDTPLDRAALGALIRMAMVAGPGLKNLGKPGQGGPGLPFGKPTAEP